jgi:hypothetical protein
MKTTTALQIARREILSYASKNRVVTVEPYTLAQWAAATRIPDLIALANKNRRIKIQPYTFGRWAALATGKVSEVVRVGSRVELPARSDYRFEDPDTGFEGDTHGDVVKVKGDAAYVRMDSGRVDWFQIADLRVEA